jgi:hypothetical protein
MGHYLWHAPATEPFFYRIHFSPSCLFVLFSACTLPLAAQEKENRIALVMGVGDYDGKFGLNALPGIGKDMERMKAALESAGFTVTVVQNPTLSKALTTIDEFGVQLKKSKGVGLFYFSGHGGEYQGKNYLIPKGARLSAKSDVLDQAINAQRILNRMEDAGNGTNILFLDCCRNDLTKGAADGGMAAMNARGTFIGFATASEKVAGASTDGSPYTKALAKWIPEKGLSITDMHTKVTKDVESLTLDAGDVQTPFQYSGLKDVFQFMPGPPEQGHQLTEAEIEARVQAELARRMAQQAKEKPLTPEQVREIMQEEIRKAMKEQPKPAAKPEPAAVAGIEHLAGNWRVVEKITEAQGGWSIVWNYECKVADGVATFTGRKVSVDGKKPSRGEAQAVSTITLRLDGLAAEGNADEVNHKGERLKSAVSLKFDPSLESFSGPVSTGGEAVSRLTGSKQ